MTVHGKKQLQAFALSLLLAVGTLGANCDGLETSEIDQNSTSCQNGVAQILIMDGLSKRLCGCNEAGDTLIYPPATLTCTVSRGTKVFFHFSAAHLRHQIVPVGSPAFPASDVYDPSPDAVQWSHAVTVSTAGTYTYRDNFDTAINGQITAL